MLLLSRTAEHLYWLGRHLERIEWSARIVREHTQLLVDLPIDVESDWSALLDISGGADERPGRPGDPPGETEVIHQLMASDSNPGSIVRTIGAARENLRVTRQIVPWTLWESLNTLHITVRSQAPICSSRSMRLDLCDAIIESCQRMTGDLSGTMNRDHAFALFEIGRSVERADMMARVLDVRAGALLIGSGEAVAPADRSPFEDVRWLGVLRTGGAVQMYHQRKTASVDADTVLDFLIHDTAFPRSIARSVLEIGSALETLPPRTTASSACDELARILANRPSTATAPKLRRRVECIIEALERLHDAMTESYFVVQNREAAAV